MIAIKITPLVFVLFVIFVFIQNPEVAQAQNTVDTLQVVKKGDRWVFVDTTGAELVIPVKKYEAVGEFNAGMAPVSNGKKWGFINADGIEIVPHTYDRYLPFHHGLTAVKLDEKWGLLNSRGEEVIKPAYKFIDNFNYQRAWVHNGDKGGYIDTTGKVVIPLIYEKISPFSEGLAKVRKDGKLLIIDTAGIVKATLEYEEMSGFINGLASFTKEGKKGIITSGFKEVVPPVYDHISFPWPNHIAAKDEKGWSIISANGKKRITLDQPYLFFSHLVQFSGLPTDADVAIFHNKDLGLYGLINSKGVEVVKPYYDYISTFFDYRRLIVSKGGKYGVINQDGKEIVPLKYSMINEYYEGLASVYDDNNMTKAYIDTNGVEVIQIPYHSVPGNFKNGICWITNTQNGFLEGAIDTTGEIIMPYFAVKYQACGTTKFLITGGGRKGMFYVKEKKHIRPVYDEIADINADWVMVMQYGKWGWVDHSGNVKIPCRYDAATPFNDKGWATVLQAGKQFRIDKKGEVIGQ